MAKVRTVTVGARYGETIQGETLHNFQGEVSYEIELDEKEAQIEKCEWLDDRKLQDMHDFLTNAIRQGIHAKQKELGLRKED